VKARRAITITTQSDEAIILRSSKATTAVNCPQCSVEVPMFSPEQAATLFRLPLRQIYRAIEAGQLHFKETAGGAVLLCLNSLKQLPSLAGISSSQNQNR